MSFYLQSKSHIQHGLAAVPASLWLIGPYFLALVVFLALPLSNVLQLSFYTYSPITIWTTDLTLQNYHKIFTPYFAKITLRTVRIGALATFFCVLLGYPLAYYFSRCSKRSLSVGMFILVMPLMVSAVVGAFGWIVILGRNGLLNGLLKTLNIDADSSILYTETAVVVALVHFLLPLMVLPLMASMEKISMRLEEAATNLGASPLFIIRRIIIPLSRAGLVSGCLLCFTVAISVVVTSALLGGRSGRMLGNEIYDQVITAYDWPFASSLAIVLVTLIVIALSAALVAARRGNRTKGMRS
jgi:ABC-type spermidine/putrescine transport system permease subunit I